MNKIKSKAKFKITTIRFAYCWTFVSPLNNFLSIKSILKKYNKKIRRKIDFRKFASS